MDTNRVLMQFRVFFCCVCVAGVLLGVLRGGRRYTSGWVWVLVRYRGCMSGGLELTSVSVRRFHSFSVLFILPCCLLARSNKIQIVHFSKISLDKGVHN